MSADVDVGRLVLIRLLSSAVDLVNESDALLVNDALFVSAVRSAGLVFCGIAEQSKEGKAAAHEARRELAEIANDITDPRLRLR